VLLQQAKSHFKLLYFLFLIIKQQLQSIKSMKGEQVKSHMVCHKQQLTKYESLPAY